MSCLFFLYFSLLQTPFSVAITPSSQVQALQSLYNSTNGDKWRWKDENLFGPKWSFDVPQADPCNENSDTWQGITCSSPPSLCRIQQCVITSVRLGDYGLAGTLPFEMFPSLSSLITFQITSSNLTGTVPSSIGCLTNLQLLTFAINDLTGPIPTTVGSLHNLLFLDMSVNRLTGVIPYQLESLSLTSVLYLQWNNLTGTIPSNLGKMTNLDIAFFGVNRISGSIPSELGSLSRLSIISFEDNVMSGLIPSELDTLSQLVALNLCKNKLTGSLPSEIFKLTKLRDLQVTENILSQTISTEISLLTKLTLLALDYNHFTDSIPFEIGSLKNLRYLDISNNLLSGSIPSEFGSLQNLETLFLAINHFSHAIPSEIGSLSEMRDMYLFENSFTGPLPTSLSQLTNLVYFHFYSNHFSGPLSFPIHSFPSLRQFFIQQNSLTGNLHQLLPSPSLNSSLSSNSSLVNFDVSDNLFSGSIPSSLFLLSQLESISLSLNCFQHKLPSTICEAEQVEVLSMDGLGSSVNCPNVVSVSFLFFHSLSLSLGQTMDGTIPECIWQMSKLGALNLAGNGLKGEIGSVSNMSSLLTMTLSHNYLSGVIPFWLQEKNMTLLDLSHNKFRGDIHGFKNQFHTISAAATSDQPPRSLKLTVNRLSGDLFDVLDTYSSLDILSGNLFSCRNTPRNDLNCRWSTCGSEEYDQAMYGMGGVLLLITIGLLFYCFCLILSSVLFHFRSSASLSTSRTWLLHWVQKRLADVHLLIQYVRYYSTIGSVNTLGMETQSNRNINRENLKSIISFGYLLSYFMKSIGLLTILSVLLFLPIYILKEISRDSDNESDQEEGTDDYVTHNHMYHWLWTMAFLSGPIPAILILTVTLVCLLLFSLILNHIVEKDRFFSLTEVRLQSQSSLQTSDSTLAVQGDSSLSYPSDLDTDEDKNKNFLAVAIVWVIFILNIVVVGTVNGLYLWSTLMDLSPDVRVWIQVGLGFFKFFWSVLILRRLLSPRIKESRYGVWLFSCLSVMNNVIIPCLVTALSNPSCYQVQ
jgi:Leucine-rich repeat (LRR) protein